MGGRAIVQALLATLLLVSAACPAAVAGIRPHVKLPDEPVRSVIFRHCASCHGIDEYAYHALDRSGWQNLLTSMHTTKPSGAFAGKPVKMSPTETNVMLAYLAENFGPDSIAFPREYVPPKITSFLTDTDARVFVDTVCTECHELRVFRQRNTTARWRELMLDMQGNGARLNDVELEQLVEWLGRVRGPDANN